MRLQRASPIDPNFHSGRVLSYNFNIQQEPSGTVFQAAYVGSQGRHLRLSATTTRAVKRQSDSLPRELDQRSIMNESSSRSNYNGLWFSAEQAASPRDLRSRPRSLFPNRST